MSKRIVNIVFITLIVLTLVCVIVGFLSYILPYENNNDTKLFAGFASFAYTFVTILVVGNELFLWRSLVFLVTYPGHKKIELVANILIAGAAVASLGYMGYAIFINPLVKWLVFPLYAIGFQIVCKIFTWVVGTIAICRGKE